MSTSLAWLNFNMCYGVIFTSSKCIIYLDYLHQPHCQQSQNSLVWPRLLTSHTLCAIVMKFSRSAPEFKHLKSTARDCIYWVVILWVKVGRHGFPWGGVVNCFFFGKQTLLGLPYHEPTKASNCVCDSIFFCPLINTCLILDWFISHGVLELSVFWKVTLRDQVQILDGYSNLE